MGIEAGSPAIAKVEDVRRRVVSLATATYRGCHCEQLRNLLAEPEGIALPRAYVRHILEDHLNRMLSMPFWGFHHGSCADLAAFCLPKT
jgi:hypothetical protein